MREILVKEDRIKRERARNREDSIRDYNSAMYNAIRQGRAEGRAEGENNIVKKMRAMGMSEEQINRILSIELEEAS